VLELELDLNLALSWSWRYCCADLSRSWRARGARVR
jgi:hypothetical protein